MENEKTYFLVSFRDLENINEGKNITLKVKEIKDSSLGLGFISISGFIFERVGPIVDPTLDRLKSRYENTKGLHLSIHQILSIEEVGAEHTGLKFLNDKSNLLVMNPDQLS